MNWQHTGSCEPNTGRGVAQFRGDHQVQQAVVIVILLITSLHPNVSQVSVTSKALAVAFSIDRNELIQPIEPSPANEKARSQLLPLLTFILGFIAGTLPLGLLS